jgi:primosomal protein N' (replication factor Y) (superfamily II helicase)
VANSKPLTLRRQKSKANSSSDVDRESFSLEAEVFVDTGVFHLEHSFSYAIPSRLIHRIQPGSVVRVPFKESEALGLVAEIKPIEKAGLRQVADVLMQKALSVEDLKLVEAMAERYVSHRFDVIKQFLPPLSMKVPMDVELHTEESTRPEHYRRRFLLAKTGETAVELAADFVAKQNRSSLLVILPTERDVGLLIKGLHHRGVSDYIEYDTKLKPTIRRQRFVEIADGKHRLVIGSRSAVLLPFPAVDHIVVVNEYSENYFEKRSPYWNVRDVALLRADISRTDITFIGSAPSLEMWRLIQIGWVEAQKGKSRILGKEPKIRCAPESFHATIRDGLKKGVVLISVSTKNYANTFICRKCKTVARCNCGGKIMIAKRGTYACTMCEEMSSDWRCRECQSHEIVAFRGGVERLYEEIGKAFPRVPIRVNTAEKPIDELPSDPSILVSTFGVEPVPPGGYSALVLLDGEELMSRPFIRAEEDLRQRWFALAGLVSPGAPIYLSIAAHHPLAQSFISNRIERGLATEMREREEVQLPPYLRVIRITGETRSLLSLRQKLTVEFGTSLRVLYSHEGACLTIKCEHDAASSLLKALKALQKARSMAKRELFKIEVDPYFV